jgi:hypothetical protein
MVERLAVEARQRYRATPVFGVAGLARPSSDHWSSAMVSTLRTEIRCHLFVTIQTETVLPRFIQRLMALVARALVACVLRYEFTRQD